MEDAVTLEEEDTDSQDSNIPIDQLHLAWNCSMKIITLAVKASVISSLRFFFYILKTICSIIQQLLYTAWSQSGHTPLVFCYYNGYA